MPSPSTTKKTAKKAPAKKGPTPARKRTQPTVEEAPQPGLSVVQPIPSTDPAGADAKYAATTWGAAGDPLGAHDLPCPSGQLCLVRKVGVQGLMAAGVLHNIDRLSALVSDKHLSKKGKGKPGKPASDEVAVARLMKDPEQLAEIMHTVDRVVCHVVVKPEIVMAPNDVTARKPGVIYSDAIDLVDKMFIFNYVVGGSKDLESFRLGLAGAMGSMESGEDVSVSPE